MRSLDNDLSRIQAFILDAIAPLTSQCGLSQSRGHTNRGCVVNWQRQLALSREKVVTSVNKAFAGASPNLFGPHFAKRSKEFLDQVRFSLPVRTQSEYRKRFFCKGLLFGRGSATRGRGGASMFRKNRQNRSDQRQVQ